MQLKHNKTHNPRTIKTQTLNSNQQNNKKNSIQFQTGNRNEGIRQHRKEEYPNGRNEGRWAIDRKTLEEESCQEREGVRRRALKKNWSLFSEGERERGENWGGRLPKQDTNTTSNPTKQTRMTSSSLH